MTRPDDLIWCAGFLDGEACFHVGDRKPSISVIQVGIEPLDRLKEALGGGIYFQRKLPSGKIAHQWRLGRQGDIIRAVDLTIPWLTGKWTQAVLLRNYCYSLIDAATFANGDLVLKTQYRDRQDHIAELLKLAKK